MPEKATPTTTMWLHQLNQTEWDPRKYRLEIWEGERSRWPVRRMSTKPRPQPGDSVVFFYAEEGGKERSGIYGWGVVLQWSEAKDEKKEDHTIHFRPVAPSDQLKIRPWRDDDEQDIVDKIRRVKQGTLFTVTEELASDIGEGIARWVGGHGAITHAGGRTA